MKAITFKKSKAQLEALKKSDLSFCEKVFKKFVEQKTKLLLFALAFGLMSSTCSTDEPTEETIDTCNCKKVYYDYGVTGFGMGGVQPIWGYTKVGETSATQMECSLDTGEYIQIDTNSYYKIECE